MDLIGEIVRWVVIATVIVPLCLFIIVQGCALLYSFADEVALHPEKSVKYLTPDELRAINAWRSECGLPPYERF